MEWLDLAMRIGVAFMCVGLGPCLVVYMLAFSPVR